MKYKRDIGFEIKTVSNLIRHNFVEKIIENEPKDLTAMQQWIIGFIYRNRDKDIFQKDIEHEFKIRRSTVTGMLQLLEKKGYIERQAVLYDARLKKIVLTDKSMKIQKSIELKIDEFENYLKSGFTDDEMIVFYKFMDKLKKKLE